MSKVDDPKMNKVKTFVFCKSHKFRAINIEVNMKHMHHLSGCRELETFDYEYMN